MWVHYDCVDENEEDIVGLWTCQNCRKVPNTINKLLNKMSVLEVTLKLVQETNNQLVKMVTDQGKD